MLGDAKGEPALISMKHTANTRADNTMNTFTDAIVALMLCFEGDVHNVTGKCYYYWILHFCLILFLVYLTHIWMKINWIFFDKVSGSHPDSIYW